MSLPERQKTCAVCAKVLKGDFKIQHMVNSGEPARPVAVCPDHDIFKHPQNTP